MAESGVRHRILLVGWTTDIEPLVMERAALDVAVVTVEADDRACDLVRSDRFDAAFVVVSQIPDWLTCGRIAAAADAPVAVVTHFISHDPKAERRAP